MIIASVTGGDRSSLTTVGEVVGGVVVGAVVGVPPVHVTPFTAKLVGAGLLRVHEPLKPNDAVPLVATEPL